MNTLLPPETDPVVNPAQCRAARGLLGWSQNDLAREAGLSKTSIVQFETTLVDTRHETRRLIAQAFVRFGVEFLPPSGVNRRTALCHVFNDETAIEEAWPRFLQSLMAMGHRQLTLFNWPDFTLELLQRTGIEPILVNQDDGSAQRAAILGCWMILPILNTRYRLALYQDPGRQQGILQC